MVICLIVCTFVQTIKLVTMKSGIYTITNKINSKIYVGYAKDITTRIYQHKGALKANRHKNLHLQNAYNQYGKENFIYEILENCLEKELCAREHYWATILNTHNREFGYNEKPTDPNGIGSEHSESTKKKISLANTGKKQSQESKDKISAANKGNKHSKETKDKISRGLKGKAKSPEAKKNISKGQKGKILTQATKNKISKASKGRIISEETRQKLKNKKIGFKITWGDKISKVNFANEKITRRKVVQLNLMEEEIEVWDSLLKVERTLGINNANLHKCCKANLGITNKFLTLKGFIWKFESKNNVKNTK